MTKQYRRNAIVAPEKYWRYGKTIQDEPMITGKIGNPQLSPNQSVDCMERVQRSDGSGSRRKPRLKV